MFNNEQYCTKMNKTQVKKTSGRSQPADELSPDELPPNELPWDNPRFRNWIAVGRACHLMQATLSRMLQPLDLKVPHLDILANLYRFEGLTQQELARKLLVGRSNMSMLLPQMEKRGLIERRSDARDKRVLRLYLTEPGATLTRQAMQIQMQLVDRSMQISGADECDMVGEVMGRIIAELKDDLS